MLTQKQKYEEICKYCEPFLEINVKEDLWGKDGCRGCIIEEKYGVCQVYDRITQMSNKKIDDIFKLIKGE